MIAATREQVTVGSTVRIGPGSNVYVVAIDPDGIIGTSMCRYPWSRIIFDAPKAEPGKRYWWKRTNAHPRAVIGVISGQVAWTADSINGGTMFWFEPFDPATMIPEGGAQ